MSTPLGLHGHVLLGGHVGKLVEVQLLGRLIVAGIIWFVRKGDGPGQSGARAELDMRFARGEIDAEDYAARKKLLAE